MTTNEDLFKLTTPSLHECRDKYDCPRLKIDNHTACRCLGAADDCPWVGNFTMPYAIPVEVDGITMIEEDDRYLCLRCGSKGHLTRSCPGPL